MTKNDQKINIPGYRIIKKVGEGGMSVVYLAYQESLKREVALKVMRPIITDEENVVSRFIQEAEIIAKLYHPNIVSIFEVGHVDDDWLFYSMPYLVNGDLSTYIYEDDESLKQIIASVCDGIAYAHSQGVIHRDIKPENILFDQHGHVQIADFGIALNSGKTRFTKDSRIIGSVHYMSPEQAQSKEAGPQSDIYGLGVILYEVLTGEPVFDEENELSIMMAHVTKPIPILPAELQHWQPVIERCLAKDPKQRFNSMDDLKQTVMSLDPKTVQKPQINWLKWVAPALVLAVFVGVLWWVFNREYFSSNQPPNSEFNQTKANDNPAGSVVSDVADSSINQPPKDETSDANGAGDQGTESMAEEPFTGYHHMSDDEVAELLQKAQSNIDKKQLTIPENDNALDQILVVLQDQLNHSDGLDMLSEVMAGYYDLLYQAVDKSDLKQAAVLADSVGEVRHRTILVNDSLLAQLEQNTDIERSLLLGVVVEKVTAAKASLDHQKAQQLIRLLDQVIPGHELVDDLLESVSSMLKTGQILKDQEGINTVVISPQYKSQKGLLNYGLAVTQSEVTLAQFDRYSKATKQTLKRCKSKLKSNLFFSQRNYTKPGFKVSDDMPVVCVTWLEANQYAKWLSGKTGHYYRLPTAREWRHIKKLTATKLTCGEANLAGQEFPDKTDVPDTFPCDDGTPFVAPIDQSKRDKLGLFGLQDNVSEWVSGCKKLGKIKAIFNPDDACDTNPMIGRSWQSGTTHTGKVEQIKFDTAWTHIGFRLIRDLRKE